MKNSTTDGQVIPFDSSRGFEDELTAILQKGAQRMLQAAIESEVADYVANHTSCRDDNGYRLVVRKYLIGHLMTGRHAMAWAEYRRSVLLETLVERQQNRVVIRKPQEADSQALYLEEKIRDATGCRV